MKPAVLALAVLFSCSAMAGASADAQPRRIEEDFAARATAPIGGRGGEGANLRSSHSRKNNDTCRARS